MQRLAIQLVQVAGYAVVTFLAVGAGVLATRRPPDAPGAAPELDVETGVQQEAKSTSPSMVELAFPSPPDPGHARTRAATMQVASPSAPEEAASEATTDAVRFIEAGIERLQRRRSSSAALKLIKELAVAKYDHDGNYLDVSDMPTFSVTELVGARKDEPHFLRARKGKSRIYIVGDEFLSDYSKFKGSTEASYRSGRSSLTAADIDGLVARAKEIAKLVGH